MNYRYVLFLPWTDYAKIMFSDLDNVTNISLVLKPFKNDQIGRILEKLYKIHFLSRFRNFIPFKSLWNRFVYSESFDNPDCVCFVFFMSDLKKTKRCFFDYLKRRYPGCKFVMYFEDTVASRISDGKCSLDFEYLNKYFDLVLSYNLKDCEEYGYIYYPTPYSKVKIQEDNQLKKSDLFFCGMAKKRYKTIFQIFKKCVENGLDCDINISSFPLEESKVSGINYLNGMMPYPVYLQHLKKASCILEINQQGTLGYTLRIWEALVYGKKLITDNTHIISEPFYDPNQFEVIQSIDNLDVEFINRDCTIIPRWADHLSPIKMIEFIENQLNSLIR